MFKNSIFVGHHKNLNPMEKKTSLLQFTMTYGAILGIITIILSLLLYIAGYMPYNFKRIILLSLVSITIMIVFIVVGTKSYRDKVLDGTISYAQALVVGLLIVVFSTILAAFYNLIFNAFIDPEYTNKVLEATKNWMYDFMNNMGTPDAQIEEAMDKIEKQQAEATPLKSFFQSIYTSIIFGTILSLITSAFIKKNKNPFS